jgi:hypothetical protein
MVMDSESLDIAHQYVSIEWARRTVEHDLKVIQMTDLKYPGIYEQAAVQVLDRLSIQMRDLKRVMREKDIKVVYKGRKRGLYEAIQYDLYVGKRRFPLEYSPDRLKVMAFETIEKALQGPD